MMVDLCYNQSGPKACWKHAPDPNHQPLIRSRQMATVNGRLTYTPRHWTLDQRLDYHTDRSGGPDACWVWLYGKNTRGYGNLKVAGRMVLAHRLWWERTHGPISGGLHALHKCDRPECVNPAHLYLGTPADNAIDRESRGRGKYFPGAANGCAKLTEDQVREIMIATGSQTAIAARFGISQTTVSEIRLGKSWVSITQRREGR